MNMIKRAIAAVLTLIMALSFVSCHQPKAVVAQYKDYQIESGVYLALMLAADSEFRQTVYNSLTEAGQTTANIDYQKQKIGDKKYKTWVGDRTRELAAEYLYTEWMFDDMKLKMDDEDIENLDNQVNYYWSYYGYGSLYEPNGVSAESYHQYYANQYKKNMLMLATYGEGGKKEISEDDLKKALNEDYCLADIISESLKDESGNALDDNTKKSLLTKLKGYADRLEKGESFETVYKEHYPDAEDNTASTPDEEGEEPKPQDKYASVISSEDTSGAGAHFEEIHEMKTGTIKVIEAEDSYILAVRKDILGDPFYMDSYHDIIITSLKADEFDKDFDAAVKKISIKINDFEANHLNPKKIEYPEQ